MARVSEKRKDDEREKNDSIDEGSVPVDASHCVQCVGEWETEAK